MSTSIEPPDERGDGPHDEIASRRPPEPDETSADPWATVRLDRSAPNGPGKTRRIPTDEPARRPSVPGPGDSPDDASFDRPNPQSPQPTTDPWTRPAADPWIDVTPGAQASAPLRTPTRGRRVGAGAGLFVAGAVVGALLTGVYTGWGANASATALTGQNGPAQPGAPDGSVQGEQSQNGQGLQGQGGQGRGGQGFGAGPGFANGGEQRVYGTLTAVSSSKLGVKTSSGTTTISSNTQILRNGQLASASDLRVGDAVLVHVFPATNSDGVLERVIARSGSGSGRSSSSDTSSSDDGATT
jgi:hypothetical protein